MLRAVTLALAALVGLAPLAAAEPVTVAYTPDGVTFEDADRYYLKLVAGEPETPHQGAAHENDCAWEERPESETGAAWKLVARILRADLGSGSFSDWFPRCAATPVGAGGASVAYASYNVSTGRYYVEGPAMLPVGDAAPAASMGYTGTTGVAVVADCVGCPPPTCC